MSFLSSENSLPLSTSLSPISSPTSSPSGSSNLDLLPLIAKPRRSARSQKPTSKALAISSPLATNQVPAIKRRPLIILNIRRSPTVITKVLPVKSKVAAKPRVTAKTMAAAKTMATIKYSPKFPSLLRNEVPTTTTTPDLSHLEPPFSQFWSPPTSESVSTASSLRTTAIQFPKEGQTLFFTYGQEMASSFMEGRYPGVACCGIAKLSGFKWSLGGEGIPVVGKENGAEVWGVIFSVSEQDLRVLRRKGERKGMVMEEADVRIGVGDFGGSGERGNDVKAQVLVGQLNGDEKRQRGKILGTMITAMNRAIVEAKVIGMPEAYVESVLRKWVPLPQSPSHYWG